MRPGERWPALPAGFNDRITSIRVFGDAGVRIFNDSNFRSVSLLIDRDLPDLRFVPIGPGNPRNWNDRVSSIAVFPRGRDEWRDRREEWRERREERRDWRDRRY